MGWKNGSPCWYCNASLAALMALPDCFRELAYGEFERHMQALCIADPQTDWERKAAEKLAWEMEQSGLCLHDEAVSEPKDCAICDP